MQSRTILHVDMDAFYASVEELDQPSLRGKPLIVGGASRRGVVAAANYAVRRFGVHSAMPIREALRRCPDAVCVAPRMSRYREVSDQIFEIFHELTPLVEGLSLDEAFLDVTASEQLFGGPSQIGAQVRRRIRAGTGLAASVGIAANKLVAKIASDLAKPDGLLFVGRDDLHAILDPLPIQRLWGVGPKTLPSVHAAGIRCFGDLRTANNAVLWRAFGKDGEAMRARAAGADERPVVPDRREQSLSAESTFETDIGDPSRLQAELLRLVDRMAGRLRAVDRAASCVFIKIRRSDFTTYSRRHSFEPATQDTAALFGVASTLLEAWRKTQPNEALRLLGVGVEGLRELRQQDLFEAKSPKASQLDTAVDDIRRRFGNSVLTRASHLRGAAGGPGPRPRRA